MPVTVGLGDTNALIKVYIANRPMPYQHLSVCQPIVIGDIAELGRACGNGWRKVFNVYAKLVFALQAQDIKLASGTPNWQHYRDNHLLQAGSATALLFSPPVLDEQQQAIQIISGRTYANALNKQQSLGLFWLTPEFAVNPRYRLFVCPYFDYRQLSNDKIGYLQSLLGEYLAQPCGDTKHD
nr:hypothetical protein [Bowmanella yangjiangensis]